MNNHALETALGLYSNVASLRDAIRTCVVNGDARYVTSSLLRGADVDFPNEPLALPESWTHTIKSTKAELVFTVHRRIKDAEAVDCFPWQLYLQDISFVIEARSSHNNKERTAIYVYDLTGKKLYQQCDYGTFTRHVSKKVQEVFCAYTDTLQEQAKRWKAAGAIDHFSTFSIYHDGSDPRWFTYNDGIDTHFRVLDPETLSYKSFYQRVQTAWDNKSRLLGDIADAESAYATVLANPVIADLADLRAA